MIKSLFIATLLVLAGCTSQKEAPATDAQAAAEFQKNAEQAIAQFQSQLKAALLAGMQEGGPAKAITVCSERAPELAKGFADTPYSIKRIGVRVRNQKTNVPNAAERELLMQLTKEAPSRLYKAGDKHAFMKGIFIDTPVCLVCHGAPENIAEEVRGVLAERYPDDAAVNFAEGDLRGALVVQER